MKKLKINSKTKKMIGLIIISAFALAGYFFYNFTSGGCNSSFSDTFILKYDNNGSYYRRGEPTEGSYYNGIVLESGKYMIKGSIFDRRVIHIEYPSEYDMIINGYDLPPDNSKVKANFEIESYGDRKILHGTIVDGNKTVQIDGWNNLGIILCKRK